MRGATNQQSLFSRHRASSVERELARTPYAFTPKPRDADEYSDILTQRLIGPEILPGDLETIKKAREQILDPFEDDINVRLAKEKIFGGYSKSGSRAPSPTIFPTNDDFEKKLKHEHSGHFENLLFGPDVSFDTNSNYSEKLSESGSLRTSNVLNERVKPVPIKRPVVLNNSVRPKTSVQSKVDSGFNKLPNRGVKTRNNSPVRKESQVIRRSSDLTVIKDNKSDISSINSSVNNNIISVVKPKHVTIQRTPSSERSGSNDTIDEESLKNIPLVSPIKTGEKEPAFKLREFVDLKENFGDPVFPKHPVNDDGVKKFRSSSRAQSEEFLEKKFKFISNKNHASSQDTGSDEGKAVIDVTILPSVLPRSEPFKVLAAPQPPAADLESVSSTVSSYKLPQAARPHRVSAFAILGDAVASAPGASEATAPIPVPSSETESQTSSAVPAVTPITVSGRVSPFRGRGFKADSRHATPRTSRAASPLRSRTNSLSQIEVAPKVDSRNPLVYERSPTPARNYIKENIEEVKELSEFNRERNEELAEQRRLEEEMEILKELGVIDPKELANKAKISLRSRSGSPSALLYYENINVPNSRIINARDGYDVIKKRAHKVSPRNVVSLPQSKTGSPTHKSRIPKRRSSLTPPTDESDYFNEPSVMTNALSTDGRFISNSTSSIYDNRVFSVITDVDNKPIDIQTAKVRSKSSSNLIPGPSILKSKPPRPPSRPGPPPSHRNLNAKRLSPIVSTPDKSPVPDMDPTEEKITFQGKSFTQIKAESQASKGKISDKKTRTNLYEKASTRKIESKSKPGTPKLMSPTRVPKRPSKSLVTSPATSRTPSRAPSRAPSRGPVSRGKDPSPLKSTPSSAKFTPGSKPSYTRNTPTKDDRMSMRSDSSETEKRYQLKRVNSRSSIASKVGPSSGGKPDLKRTDSRNSIKPLTRTNSIKSMRDKPGTKRRPSMKDVDESAEESSGKGKSNSRSKPKKSTNKKETNTDDIDKQDSETQYDKTSHLQLTMEKLIPLTKTNVVSMTTAAITAQPLEIAAKVTSQLPSALEKARERGVFDRNSSTDSMAGKVPQQSDVTKTDEDKEKDDKTKEETSKNKNEKSKMLGDNAALQKSSSKTSIGSKDDKDKDGLKRSDSIILTNNLKLKPIKTPLDPKVEKVKMKIDNILNSSQSSFEDIREKVKKVEKAVEKSQQLSGQTEALIEKKSEESAKKMEDAVSKTETEVKQLEKTVSKVDDKMGEVINDGIKKAENVPKETVTKVTEEVKNIAKDAEKPVSSVIEKKPSEKMLTPIETSVKTESAKPSEPKPPSTPVAAASMKINEEVVKKEALTPTITIVNEKARGATSEEHVTEKIIKGEPDVEVQSGNIPMEKKMTSTSLEETASIANGAGTSNGHSKKLPPESNGSAESGGVESKRASMVASAGADEDAEDAVDKKKSGCCGGCSIFPCCKSKNLSEVQLIDENIGKKRMSKSEKSSMKADEEEKKGWASRMICCRGKNKVRDSSLPRHSLAPSDATARSTSRAGSTAKPPPRGRCASIFCCCCKKKDDMDNRRDSILSNRPKQKWYKRMLCCCRRSASKDASRRTSMFSKKRSLSQAVPLQEDKRTKLDTSLIEHTSMLRGAIPALHMPLAWICLICNILVPGLGTVLSGMFCLCFGRPRFGVYDGWKPRIGAFVIDLIVGVGQLFTVLFCLVGWGWSIWWATIIYKVAKKYQKLKTMVSDPEQGQAATNNHRTNAT